MPDKARLILDAAMALAEEGGFEAVRLRDVASRANVALGTLYSRFRSKEDILVAVLDEAAARLEVAFAKSPPTEFEPADRVNRHFEVITRLMFARPNFAKAVLRAVSAGTVETASKVARYQDRFNRLIVTALHGDRKGAPSPVPEALELEVAFLLQQVWFAVLVGWMSGIRSEEDVLRQMRTTIGIVLRGAKAP